MVERPWQNLAGDPAMSSTALERVRAGYEERRARQRQERRRGILEKIPALGPDATDDAILSYAQDLVRFESPVKRLGDWDRGFIQVPLKDREPRRPTLEEAGLVLGLMRRHPDLIAAPDLQEKARYLIGQAYPQWEKTLGATGRTLYGAINPFGITQRVTEEIMPGGMRGFIEQYAPPETFAGGEAMARAAEQAAAMPGEMAAVGELFKVAGKLGGLAEKIPGVRQAQGRVAALLRSGAEKTGRWLEALRQGRFTERYASSWARRVGKEIAAKGGRQALKPREVAEIWRVATRREASSILNQGIGALRTGKAVQVAGAYARAGARGAAKGFAVGETLRCKRIGATKRQASGRRGAVWPMRSRRVSSSSSRLPAIEFAHANWPKATYHIAPYQKAPALLVMTEGKPRGVIAPMSAEREDGTDGYDQADFEKAGWQFGPRKAPKGLAAAAVEAPPFRGGPRVRQTSLLEEELEVDEELAALLEKEDRPWPEQIRAVGGDFWTELLSAGRDLRTKYRYAPLRGGVLGRFSPEKGISTFDVSFVLTGSHELGHALDYLMNDRNFPRSIQLRFGQTSGDRALRAELAEVSKVLRPDAWAEDASANMQRYVRKHQELMGDFISAYLLDVPLCHRLAPTVTRLFESKLAGKPELQTLIDHLHTVRDHGPERPAVSAFITEHFQVERPKFGLGQEEAHEYVEAVKMLGLQRQRHYKSLIYRAFTDAKRIEDLALKAAKGDEELAQNLQADWAALIENAPESATGKTLALVKRELTPEGKKAIVLGRGYFEMMRQTANKYLRGAGVADWIKWLDAYFLHAYHTPMTERTKSAIAKWAKRSPQQRKRVLPSLAEARKMGFVSRADTLSEGVRLWAGINFRVMTNLAILEVLPKITNHAGEFIIQKPADRPAWPQLDHYALRWRYRKPLGDRGILLWEGRVAVDPKVAKHLRATFGTPFTGRAIRAISALNALYKAFNLTVLSLFHHQALLTSGFGGLGVFKVLFGAWGKQAERFGAERGCSVCCPCRISRCGKRASNCSTAPTSWPT